MAETLRGLILRDAGIERVLEAGGPLTAAHVAELRCSVVAAVERDGKIVAYWPLWLAVHAEPLWTAEDARAAGVIRVLVETVKAALEEEGTPTAFAIIGYGDQDLSLSPALRLGFKRVPGDLYFVNARDPGTLDVGAGGSSHGSSSHSRHQPGGQLLREPGQAEAGRAGPPDLPELDH